MAEKEYIEREKIKSYISQLRDHTSANVGLSDAEYSFISDVKDALESFPAADVAPVKHGHWVEQENWIPDDYYYTCSACGEDYLTVNGTPDYNYCPNCGAKMDE